MDGSPTEVTGMESQCDFDCLDMGDKGEGEETDLGVGGGAVHLSSNGNLGLCDCCYLLRDKGKAPSAQLDGIIWQKPKSECINLRKLFFHAIKVFLTSLRVANPAASCLKEE